MFSKTLNLTISNEIYPMLFNLNKNNFNNICEQIFKYGYNKYFPTILDTQSDIISCVSNKHDTLIQTVNDKNNVLSGEINLIKNMMSSMNIDKKLSKFEDIVQDLFGITKHSSKKGQLGEDIIYKIIRNRFKDCTLKETRGKSHYGDAILKIPKNNNTHQILIEIKNYSRPIDTNEINKMKYDMTFTGIKYGLFISLKSGYVGKKQMCIEKFNHKNEIFTILYIPNVMNDINKIESSILLLDRIIELEYNSLDPIDYSLISNKLTDLDVIYDDCKVLRKNFGFMETNIKQQIHNFYIILKNYEDELRKKINSIWAELNNEIEHLKNKSEVENTDHLIELIKDKKTISMQILTQILKIIRKYNLTISCINNDQKYTSMCWHFNDFDGANNVKGSIVKKGTFIEVSIHNPLKVSLTFDDVKDKNKIKVLNGVLQSLC
jgi:hypothetical protein